ncbi:MAG TPA: hypothetical protein DCR60_01510 [Psychrobacter sp.]|nr:hypothetical protein [Psychrobacter sp.]|tara:strand:+ start:1717 stop:2571 length:855 start_codon:yes stop_codon:yes gene_type:complete
MSYYNLEQTLEVFQKKLPETLLPFDLPQLADLCRRGEVTPVFSYDKYINEGLANERELPTYLKQLTMSFNGYLTLPDLSNLLFQLKETVVTSTAYVYEEIGTTDKGAFVSLENYCYDHFEDYHDGHISYSSGDINYIGINNLLFPIEQVKEYISAKCSNVLDEPATIGTFGTPALTQCEPKTDKERVIELEKELASVKAELKEQTDALANDKHLTTRSQNLAAKIILALLDIAGLDKDSPPYQYDDLSSNNSLIHDQIEANGMNVGKQKIGHWLDLAINQTKDK